MLASFLAFLGFIAIGAGLYFIAPPLVLVAVGALLLRVAYMVPEPDQGA